MVRIYDQMVYEFYGLTAEKSLLWKRVWEGEKREKQR
jgi:hypothetical protein